MKNPEKIFQIFLILKWAYAPEVALSNGENSNSIAASIAELFSKQPSVFYFEMDSNRHDTHYSSNTVVDEITLMNI